MANKEKITCVENEDWYWLIIILVEKKETQVQYIHSRFKMCDVISQIKSYFLLLIYLNYKMTI